MNFQPKWIEEIRRHFWHESRPRRERWPVRNKASPQKPALFKGLQGVQAAVQIRKSTIHSWIPLTPQRFKRKILVLRLDVLDRSGSRYASGRIALVVPAACLVLAFPFFPPKAERRLKG